MRLATLNYIHSLLKHEEETQRNAKRLAYQSLENAEGADNAPALRELVEKARASWNEASCALDDFEVQDW